MPRKKKDDVGVNLKVQKDENHAYILHKMFVTTMYHCAGCGCEATIDVFSGICMECKHHNSHATLGAALQLNVVFMQEEEGDYDH